MTDAPPDLSLRPDAAFYILVKAREYDEAAAEADSEVDGDAEDESEADRPLERADALDYRQLTAAVRALNEDAQLDLIALIWIGRGDFDLDQWDEAREAARDIGRARAPRYVAGIPLVSDYLEDALSRLGLTLEDYMREH